MGFYRTKANRGRKEQSCGKFQHSWQTWNVRGLQKARWSSRNKTQPSQDLVEVSVDLLHSEGPDFVYASADYIYRQAGRKDSDVSLHSNCSGKV